MASVPSMVPSMRTRVRRLCTEPGHLTYPPGPNNLGPDRPFALSRNTVAILVRAAQASQAGIDRVLEIGIR